MQLSSFLKVPITYFFEDFRDFNVNNQTKIEGDDLNYSFLSKTFSSLSRSQKEKILQVLKNTVAYERTGWLAPRAGLEPATNWLTVNCSTNWATEE